MRAHDHWFVPSAQHFVLPFPASWDCIETGSQISIKCIEVAMITCDQAFHNIMAHESIHAKQLVMTFWHWILNKDQNTAIIPYYVKILPWHVQKLYAKFSQAELHIISKYGCALHYKMCRDEMTEDLSEIFPMLWLRAISLSYYILPHDENTRPLEVRA